MRFPRQEYWSGLPCPFPGDLLEPGMEPRSTALQVDPFPSEPPGKPGSLDAQSSSGTQNMKNHRGRGEAVSLPLQGMWHCLRRAHRRHRPREPLQVGQRPSCIFEVWKTSWGRAVLQEHLHGQYHWRSTLGSTRVPSPLNTSPRHQ